MAITKVHPIKSTLNLAIAYITSEEKTDEKILVSTNKRFASTAHTAFIKTREDNKVNGTVLARHLIQSFMPGEATPEIAHQVGMELCKRILKDQYEFVLTTHVDKGHIHNHIIFNNVNMVTVKCYQSNQKSYHQIRYQSDKLCKENNLSVIDEFYENALSDLKKYYSKLPNSKDILKELDSLHEKKNTLMQEHSSVKSDMKELYQIRKNYEIYMGREMER